MFRRIAFVFALFGFGLLAAQVWAEEASQSRHGNYNLRSHVVTQDEREYPQTKKIRSNPPRKRCLNSFRCRNGRYR